jgi:hypothetical protein
MHETGHVIAGVWAGLRFESVVLRPIKIDRRGRISLALGIGAAHGLTICVPKSADKLVQRYRLFVSGGVAANIVVGVATFCVAAAMIPGNPRHGALAMVAAGISFFMAAINLMPIRSGSYLTDGALLSMLAQGGNVVGSNTSNARTLCRIRPSTVE